MPPETEASRIASLINWASHAETLVEVAAELLLGEQSRQRVLTLLEAYKALCRLRLLHLQPAGSLMRSLPPEGDGPSGLRLGGRSELSKRAGAPMPLGNGGPARWPRAAVAHDDVSTQAAVTSPSTALQLGEILHILQPLLHLLLVQLLTPSPNPGGAPRRAAVVRAWLPWLTALLVDVAALQLCRAGTHASPRTSSMNGATAPRADEGGSGAARRLANCWRLPPQSEISADNLDELRHRRQLAMLFLMRPAGLVALKTVLRSLSSSGRAGGTSDPGALGQMLSQLLERERTSAHMFR
eukprot:Transcript_5692.p2 GENE.Transcript_5692~~Transcript_5692.p2  ORF type:complete len:298 (+),score=44.79 Transcript_5692:76-969(+)